MIVVVGGRVITSFLATILISPLFSAALDLNSTGATSIVLVVAHVSSGSFLWLPGYSLLFWNFDLSVVTISVIFFVNSTAGTIKCSSV